MTFAVSVSSRLHAHSLKQFLGFAFYAAAFILLFRTSPADAFINVETIRKQNAGDGFYGNSSVKLTGQSGNTDKLTTNLSTLNIYRGARDELMAVSSYNYGESFGSKDTNNLQGILRYTFFDRTPTAIETFVQSEFDEFKDLKSRNLLGANLRERLMEDTETSIYGGGGAFFETEDYDQRSTRRGVRLNWYLAIAEKIDERITGSATLYYQPLVTNLHNNRLRGQADLDITLTKVVMLNLEYVLSYDSWVALETVKKTDQSYLVGLTVKY